MDRRLISVCLLGLLTACTTQSPGTSSPSAAISRTSSSPLQTLGPMAEHTPQPELRYGRYTLISTAPTTEQRDPLAQIIDVNIPSSLSPSVQDALQYVLQRSGYSLCPDTAAVKVLFTRPLPAVHYRLGPISLRSALQVLAGSTWQLTTDEVSRSVCFEQQKTEVGIALITPVSPHQSEARP
ncbi:PilL N-terminal domain-containing protein [Pseudomonas sp. BF-RE-26]|uniref:PFGI-1 class ICE element type IV pilus protein PilL2 n=1 Tax=Pseudomonas sp. BF-RE-26 TaxID=2832396 RepID=UPI001CBB4B6D|nr:PilL N-terminal domain-containing protein [Pseudomonas sp. BF-RE-26]